MALRTTGEWKDGPVRRTGLHEVNIRAVSLTHGAVNLIFERDPSKRTYFFRGVERSFENPASEFAGDLPMVIRSLDTGCRAVAKSAWAKLYAADHTRRASFD